MRIARRFILTGLALLATGCVQVEYGVVLERDLSGTADIDLTVDLDRIARTTASVKSAFEGTGEPTEEQIEEARREILAELDLEDSFDADSLRAEIEPELPDGVRLIDVEEEQDGLQRRLRMDFAFDHVDRLRELNARPDRSKLPGANSEGSNVFEGLEIVESDGEIIVRNDPIDPIDEVEDNPFVSEGMIENMLQDFSVTFRLETPFEVIEHNATRREGRTLIWVFDWERLQQDEPTGIYARLRR
jgi:hypothetical protein